MRVTLVAAFLAAIAAATPLPGSDIQKAPVPSSTTPLAYTAAINPAAFTEPPPLWDPEIPRPPPLFDAPAEDIPDLPSSLVSVLEAPVQAVRLERINPFTSSNQHPVDNIYRASNDDPEGRFAGEGSLRPARRTFLGGIVGFLQSWMWWISVVVLACVLVYVAEKMLIGAVIGARRARSASRAARSRAVSLVAETRSRAASLVKGTTGRARAGTLNLWQDKVKLERSPSPPVRTRSWDESMV